MVDRKVVPFNEFYYQLKLTHVFQKHPVHILMWKKAVRTNTVKNLEVVGL
jgi:hypothetical protein